jgi:hypothetical protein
MGTAITTITGGGASITLEINETTPSESDSPPPQVFVKRVRAIAKHRIPSSEGDLGQDMGSYSPTVQVTGIGLIDVDAALDALSQVVQLDGSGAGVVTVESKNAAGATLKKVDKLALDDYSVGPVRGQPKWFSYIVNFTRFAGV